MAKVTVYVLMETDTDTVGPTVSVYATAEAAIAIAMSDIRANGNTIIDEGGGYDAVWTAIHVDPTTGQEHHSEVTRHEVDAEYEPPMPPLKPMKED